MKRLLYLIAIISCGTALAGKIAKAGAGLSKSISLEAEVKAQERALADHTVSLHSGGTAEWLKAAILCGRLERAKACAK